VSALRLQLSVLRVGNGKPNALSPQLSMLKVEIQELFAIHLFLEKKIRS